MTCIISLLKGSLQKSLENEPRLAAIAQATLGASSSNTKLPPGLRLTSVEEFEEAIRSSPTNGHLWTLYTAHHLSAGDVNKARVVVERALAIAPRILINAHPLEAAAFSGSLLQAAINLVITAQGHKGEDEKKRLPWLEAVIGRIYQLYGEAVTHRAVEASSTAGLHTVGSWPFNA